MNRNQVLIIGVASILFASVTPSAKAQLTSEEAAKKYGWGFDNFTDTEFSWDVYCNSFFGVPVDTNLSWATATFDKAFYEGIFKTQVPSGGGGGSGNCFGLSLLSLMMNKYGGYYGYCAPPMFYKAVDSQLHRVINIMHGRQVSLAALETIADQGVGGHSQNSTYFVTLMQQTLAKEGPCLVSITKTPSPTGGGHTLIAYNVVDAGGGNSHIMVVDVNRIWVKNDSLNRGWYLSGQNYIDCGPSISPSQWRFRMATRLSDWPTDGNDMTPAQPLGHGHVFAFPISVVGPPGRAPMSLGLSIGQILQKAFLSDALGGSNQGQRTSSTPRRGDKLKLRKYQRR